MRMERPSMEEDPLDGLMVESPYIISLVRETSILEET